MVFASGTFSEFARFLQIVLWIMLPVIGIALSLTLFSHYRRKRKHNQETPHSSDQLLLSPENTGLFHQQAAHVLFDHSGLIRQYRNKLSYNHARYTALKHDFEKLELKYSAAASYDNTRSGNTKNITMEHSTEHLQAVIAKLQEEFTAEKNEWSNRFEQINRSYKSLEEENESLLEQINLRSATEEEKVIVVNRWKEENQRLKDQVNEQAYLSDLLEEKKSQINFLQNQVEQRIMNFHHAERDKESIKTELLQFKQLSAEGQEQLEEIRNQLSEQENTIIALRSQAAEKEELLAEKQGFLTGKLDHIIYLENLVSEIKRQNEIMNAALADSQDLAGNLQQQVRDEQSRVAFVEQKLTANRQLLQRLYKEFSSCMDEVVASSPVVSLQAGYLNKVGEWDESAVH